MFDDNHDCSSLVTPYPSCYSPLSHPHYCHPLSPHCCLCWLSLTLAGRLWLLTGITGDYSGTLAHFRGGGDRIFSLEKKIPPFLTRTVSIKEALQLIITFQWTISSWSELWPQYMRCPLCLVSHVWSPGLAPEPESGRGNTGESWGHPDLGSQSEARMGRCDQWGASIVSRDLH